MKRTDGEILKDPRLQRYLIAQLVRVYEIMLALDLLSDALDLVHDDPVLWGELYSATWIMPDEIEDLKALLDE